MDCTLLLGQIVQTTKESAHRAAVAEAETNRISTHGISPALKEKVCVCVCVYLRQAANCIIMITMVMVMVMVDG